MKTFSNLLLIVASGLMITTFVIPVLTEDIGIYAVAVISAFVLGGLGIILGDAAEMSTRLHVGMIEIAVIIAVVTLIMMNGMKANAAEIAPAQVTAEEIADQDRDAELTLLAALVYAEAGNQDMTGKRLVVDAVLNRVSSSEFPNTITGVITQPWAFSPMKDGGIEKAYMEVTQDCFRAVVMEMETRLDTDILYFTSAGYSKYGTPMYKYGDHYFSGK